jgi:exodeoxyribonuclease VII small subunit
MKETTPLTRPVDSLDPQSPSGDSIDGLSFEQALAQLDSLVRRMESGELGLDDSIAAYRRGAELARLCQDRLAVAEKEIQKLDGDMLRNLQPEDMRGASA